MATKIKLKLDGEDDVVKGVHFIEASFEDLVNASDEVNASLDDQGKSYKDLREEMKKTEKQSDKTFGSKGGGSGGGGGGIGIIGKSAIAAFAIIELGKKVVELRQKIKDMGDAGVEAFESPAIAISRTNRAFQDLLTSSEFLNEKFVNSENNTRLMLDSINGLITGLTRKEVVEKRHLELADQQLKMIQNRISEQLESERIAKLSIKDARDEAVQLEDQLRSVESLRITDGEREKILQRILLLRQKSAGKVKEELTYTQKRENAIKLREEEEAKEFWNRKKRNEQAVMENVRQNNKAAEERRKLIEDNAKAEKDFRMEVWQKQEAAKLQEMQLAKQAHDERLKQIKEEQSAKVAAAAGEGGPASQLLGQQSEQDVLNRMAQNRGGTNADKRKLMRDLKKFRNGPARGESAEEFAKFQEQFIAEGRQAFSQNAAATITSLRNQGKLSQEQTQTLAKATKELIDQQAEQEKMSRDLQNIKRELDAVSNKRRSSQARSGAR